MRYTLEEAVEEAKRVRRNLLRLYHAYEEKKPKFPYGLAGACGLASILLAIKLDDHSILRGRPGHMWTLVKGHIIDITATQFNSLGTYECEPIRGVLVTKTPKSFHRPMTLRGLEAYKSVVNENWYSKDDYSRWRQIADHWL